MVDLQTVFYFFLIKPSRCTDFTISFWYETLNVADISSVHNQEFIHCTSSDGICHTGLYTAFEQDQNGSWSCSKAVYKLIWHIPLLIVQWINSWWWTDELTETFRVSCQNKLGKLVYLFGFIIKKLPRNVKSYRSLATRVSQLKIWHFGVIGIERNSCRRTFNGYSGLKNYKFLVMTLLSQMSDMYLIL